MCTHISIVFPASVVFPIPGTPRMTTTLGCLPWGLLGRKRHGKIASWFLTLMCFQARQCCPTQGGSFPSPTVCTPVFYRILLLSDSAVFSLDGSPLVPRQEDCPLTLSVTGNKSFSGSFSVGLHEPHSRSVLQAGALLRNEPSLPSWLCSAAARRFRESPAGATY